MTTLASGIKRLAVFALAAASMPLVAYAAGEAVHIEPPLPYARMREVYETSHLLISAASVETFGMAIYEARAHGLPIVAIDGGYVRHHFTHGDDGLWCSSHAELARTFVALAEDERRMTRLFERARETRPAPSTWREAAERFLSELARAL